MILVRPWPGTRNDFPSGTAFTWFLGTLNSTTTGCFAGHCDWRLPLVEELLGIVDLGAPGCGTGVPGNGPQPPCIDQTVFGPTFGEGYWTATSFISPASGLPEEALQVDFGVGDSVDKYKHSEAYVRGVRTAFPPPPPPCRGINQSCSANGQCCSNFCQGQALMCDCFTTGDECCLGPQSCCSGKCDAQTGLCL
jgi:hypothetical protein